MSNCLLAYPDRTLVSSSYTPVLDAGTWNANYPLANLQNPLLAAKARSGNVTVGSPSFRVNLGVSRNINVIALLRHNASSSGTVTIRAYSDVFTTLILTLNVSFWPEGYPSLEDKKVYQNDLYIPISSITARSFIFDVFDDTNPAGYFELSRCILAPSFQPAINMIYGSSIGLETETQRQRTLGGVDYYDRKEPRRIKQFTLDSLSEVEAFDSILDMQYDRGLDKELLFVTDLTDTGKRLKQRSFLGTLRTLNAIEHPYFDGHSVGFEIAEIL